MRKYYRTCQECLHRQVAKDPTTYTDNKERWRDLKCKKCKSPALDYGSYMGENYSEDDEIETL